ncbi:DUF1028 domain-containing protein [Gaiella sp.]|uniref:DUF1028 domain-containing protein n=1 Tax=Gaiella sp. TaxID=2663207 RepID=UPI0032651239
MTYSLVGRDPDSGEIGVAVQSQSFNSGAAVPWARPGVGAVATQSFTDRRYGWRGLELLTQGMTPADALTHLRDGDELVEFRQVGVMAVDGRCAQFTGVHCVPAAGGAAGENWIAQANMVESPRVWESMGEAFAAEAGSLAERLMAGLEAAEAAGGDWRGRGGAAIVVVPGEGEPWERVIDLRVEEGDGSLVELRRLLERALGYRAANRASTDREHVGLRHNLPSSHVRWLAIEDALDCGNAEGARVLFAALEREQPRWRDFVEAVTLVPGSEHFGDLLAD